MSSSKKSLKTQIVEQVLKQKGVTKKEFRVQNRKKALTILIDPKSSDKDFLDAVDGFFENRLLEAELKQNFSKTNNTERTKG